MGANGEAGEEGISIIGLHVDGFRRIRVIDMTPPRNGVVRIVGANEAGKTSLLDSIMAALKGLPKGSVSPLQRGRDRGEVVLNLGAFQVQVIYTESGEYLNVKRGDGKVAKPRAFLDEMIGQGLSFDPFAFARLKPADQVNTLLSALQLEQDPREVDKERQGYYERRTDKNREIKSLEARVASIPERADVPDEEVSVGDLLRERSEALKARLEFQNVKEKLSRADSDVMKAQAEVDRIKRVLVDAEEAVRHCQVEKEALTQALASITVPPDITNLDQRLQAIELTNKAVRAKAERTHLVVELAKAVADGQELTEAISLCDTLKESVLATANLPVPGLGFESLDGAYCVTVKGIPLAQCSSSQQLKVGMAIAVALNPKVRVCLIREGSLLDDTSIEMIDTIARERKVQVFVERVGEEAEGENSFVLEAGELKA
jgi:ABC-type cobalamin/Fe3+-siderophores transport system ATPase subunit